MDSVTQTIVNYIEQTDVTNREDLLAVSRIAFLDYLASLAPAESEQAVQELASFIGAKSSISSDVSQCFEGQGYIRGQYWLSNRECI